MENIHELEQELFDYSKNMPNIVSNLKVYPQLYKIIDQEITLLRERAFLLQNYILHDISSLSKNKEAYLVELEHSAKGKERMIEKVYNHLQNNLSVEEAVDKIEDVLRYTYVIQNDDDYIDIINRYLNELEEKGYHVYEFLNFWGNEYYQGINVLLEFHGLKIELQFHTVNSYFIKEGFTRIPYIVARNSLASQEMIDKANTVRKHYQKKVIVPNGAIGFQYKSKGEQNDFQRRKHYSFHF